MGETKAKVEAKLVLDDQATKALIKFKEALDASAHAEQKVAHEGEKIGTGGGFERIKGFASKAGMFAAGAGIAVGAAAAAGFASAKAEASELADEVGRITTESDEQIRSLAGVLTMLDDQGVAYAQVYDFAGDLKNELEDVGIAAGVSADATTAAFEEIYERGGKTLDQTMALTEEMTQAARIVPGGLAAISGGFQAVEMGVIRAKNPLVQMISATGILHGNAKAVAAQMMKMTAPEQMALAEKAIAKMAEKAEDMPLSFAQVKQSIVDIRDNMAEALGTPVLAALTTQLNRFQHWLVDHREAIEGALEDFGDDIAQLVNFVGDIFSGLEEVGMENSEDLKAIWSDLTESFRTEWELVMGHQSEIRDSMKTVVGDLIHATRVMADLVHDINETIGHMGALIRQGLKTTQPTSIIGASMDQEAIKNRLSSAASGGAQGISDDEMATLRRQYIEDANLLNQDMAKANADFTAAYADHAAVVQDVTRAHNAAIEGSAKDFGAAFDWAAAQHNEAAQRNIAEFVQGSANIQQALLSAGPDLIKTGQKGFIEALRDAGAGEFADKLKKAWAPHLGEAPNAMNVNFNGNTFNIKQDYRDQDPERVVVQFKRGIGQEAAARTTSRIAPPFSW